MGRGTISKKKVYVVVTYMVTLGVNLVTTSGIDAPKVINAISSIVDVRGVLSTLTSDNQTSFQKADNEITEWYKTVNWDAVQ